MSSSRPQCPQTLTEGKLAPLDAPQAQYVADDTATPADLRSLALNAAAASQLPGAPPAGITVVHDDGTFTWHPADTLTAPPASS